MIRRVLLPLVLLAVAFLWAPQLLEATSNPCSALEQKTIALETGGNDLGTNVLENISGGALAEQLMRNKYKNLPVPVACALEYWKKSLRLAK
ncbi:hypothetical protein [Dongia rigui]|uniref:Uncharacterized protein n=1 Tax=Dongia rigui TaxID=940149 RepID=A0ABU5E596_9PROT|nr:hypothetical protein [Dongia rigui]MDY0874113.1 hypothetical protein [Dongia rigui]